MDASSELKYAAALLVFLVGIAGGLLARRLMTGERSLLLARLANTFAGGVFLGAALIHMLPDARETLESVFGRMDYPHFALVMGIGFLVVLFVDKILGGRATASRADGGSAYPYVLALTLSIHSVITGIALGLEPHLVDAAAILIAILAHKSTAAMALAISLYKQNVDPVRRRNLLSIFYLMTPLGIIAGTLWSGALSGRDAAIAEGLFDAVAAGTFIYIAVVDILAVEFQDSRSGRLYVAAVLGFLVMALLAIWT